MILPLTIWTAALPTSQGFFLHTLWKHLQNHLRVVHHCLPTEQRRCYEINSHYCTSTDLNAALLTVSVRGRNNSPSFKDAVVVCLTQEEAAVDFSQKRTVMWQEAEDKQQRVKFWLKIRKTIHHEGGQRPDTKAWYKLIQGPREVVEMSSVEMAKRQQHKMLNSVSGWSHTGWEAQLQTSRSPFPLK